MLVFCCIPKFIKVIMLSLSYLGGVFDFVVAACHAFCMFLKLPKLEM